MKRLAILIALFVSPLGCQKAVDKIADDAKLQPDEKPKVVPVGTGNLSGGKGVVGDVRSAAARTVNDITLDQLQKSIAAMEDNGMPTAEAIKKDNRSNKQLMALIDAEAVILTGAKKSGDIWAYTKWPQRGGEHYVISSSGRDTMSAEALEKRLKAEGSPVKLAK